MIRKIEIENFKSFLKSSVELGLFNVLVGPNDSGKTNFLNAFRLLRYIAQGRLEGFFSMPYDLIHCQIPGSKPYIRLGIELEVSGETLFYSIAIEKDPKNGILIREENLRNAHSPDKSYLEREGNEIYALNERTKEREEKTFESNQPALPLLTDIKANRHAWLTAQRLRNIWFYNFDTQKMREIYTSSVEKQLVLSESGNNLSLVLYTLFNEYRENFDRLKVLLRNEIPYVNDLKPKKYEDLFFIFLGFNKYALMSEAVSDGLMKFLGILTLVCSPQSAPQINIEEIENHIHPHRLESAMDLLRSLTLRPKPSQILLTTHSPNVLNLVKPKEILIVERSPDKGSSIMPLIKKRNILPFLKEMPLGDAWISRIIGGVP